jgi:hypothetical protein
MATSSDRRRELRAIYEQQPREAGVYLLRNTVSGRVLVASSPDLRSVRNRLEFGRATGSAGVLDRRLLADARAHGVGAFELEIVDILPVPPDSTREQVLADLAELEELWRERLGAVPQY